MIDTLSKVAKKAILLSIQLIGELLVTKSNEISQESEVQVITVCVCVCVCVRVCVCVHACVRACVCV